MAAEFDKFLAAKRRLAAALSAAKREFEAETGSVITELDVELLLHTSSSRGPESSPIGNVAITAVVAIDDQPNVASIRI
jgi:hypothetical protein